MPSGKPIIGKNDLASQRPDIAKEWDYQKNNSLLPFMFTVGSNKKVWWLCSYGHHYQAAVVDRTNRDTGCPYCKGRKLLVGFNDLATTYPNLIKEWDYEKNINITPYLVTKGTNKKVWWTCKNGHSWQAIIGNRTQGRGCQVCGGFKTERLVCDVLSDLQIKFDFQKVFLGDQIIKNFKFDVWVESLRIIIEPDGLQHFQAGIDFYDKGTTFPNRRKADNLKNIFCFRHNIAILRIPYIYNPDKEQDKIKELIVNFINTRKVPQEIIDFYDQYKENNNYAEIAKKMNDL